MRRIDSRRTAYWIATAATAFVFLSGGAAYLAGAEVPVAGVLALGYPAYFVSLLGAWKLLGGLAILFPRRPLLKEWAYAGIAFELSGAAVSQAATGAPAAKVIAPLAILAVAAASWSLRPASRRLEPADLEPASPHRTETRP